jgi:hypothetical protein
MLPRSWALASQALGWDRGILTSWDGQRLPFSAGFSAGCFGAKFQAGLRSVLALKSAVCAIGKAKRFGGPEKRQAGHKAGQDSRENGSLAEMNNFNARFRAFWEKRSRLGNLLRGLNWGLSCCGVGRKSCCFFRSSVDLRRSQRRQGPAFCRRVFPSVLRT